MMRTPFFILAIAPASMMFLVFSVSGRMQGDEVGALEEIVELDLLDADILGALRRQERIERDHAHAQAQRAVGDDRTDIAATDDAEHLAGDLDAHEAVLLPFAGLRGRIGLRDFARQRQHQGDRMLGGRDRIAERRVHHDDAFAVAAGISTLSTPIPARPITLSLKAFSMILAVALVAERIASPS